MKYKAGSSHSLMLAFVAASICSAQKPDPYNYPIRIPQLEQRVTVDGDLSEWKRYAFNDGLWDIERLRQMPWYDPAINRERRQHPTRGAADRHQGR